MVIGGLGNNTEGVSEDVSDVQLIALDDEAVQKVGGVAFLFRIRGRDGFSDRE